MLSSRPLVTVIVPTYNRSSYLVYAVDSVLAQTYGNWELIIIDDGSTDNTRERLEAYLADSRISYCRQANRGQSAARNRGLALAKGAFIGFLDSDDIWLPEKLEKQLALFEHFPDADIVHGDEITIDAEGNETSSRNMTRYSGAITAQLLADNCVSMTTALVRKTCFETLGGFDESDRVAEDYELWLRFSTRYRFLYEPEYVTLYRSMTDQLSTDKASRFEANERILKNFIARFPDAVPKATARRGLSYFYSRKARYEYSVGRTGAAWRICFRSACLFPFWQGPWRTMAVLLLRRAGRSSADHG
ncbi:MAG: glycosyltransferase [Thiohalomonadales bacterium]|nr:glycosyltransferase [Thiohalomonadales bacterium]